jgi:hypothetical protein
MPTKKAAADLKVITSPPEPVLAIPPGKLGMSSWDDIVSNYEFSD